MTSSNDIHDWIDEQTQELEIADHAGAIKSWLRPCAYFKRQRAAESKLQVGASKFGGSPDVPADFSWPVGSDGQPQCFLLQLNLDELAGFSLDLALPSTGLLLVFADEDHGSEPMSAVFHFDHHTSLLRTDLPYDLPQEALRPHRMEFTAGVMLPRDDDQVESPFYGDDADAYFDLLDRFSGMWSSDTKDHIGGYPSRGQFAPFDYFFKSRAADAGYRIPNRNYLMNNVGKAERETLFEMARRISLLAQFDWIEGWMVFVADRQDFQRQAFNRVVAYYDCT